MSRLRWGEAEGGTWDQEVVRNPNTPLKGSGSGPLRDNVSSQGSEKLLREAKGDERKGSHRNIGDTCSRKDWKKIRSCVSSTQEERGQLRGGPWEIEAIT